MLSTTDNIVSALGGGVGARCNVPLQTVEVSPHCDGVVAFRRLLSGHGPQPRHLFFLDSALRHHGLSRYSLLGYQPFLVLKSKGHTITVEDDTGVQEKEGNPFEVLRSYLRAFRAENTVGAYCSPRRIPPEVGLEVAPGSSSGDCLRHDNTPLRLPGICRTGVAVGYLGYDLRYFLERLPRNTVDDLEFPDMYFGFYDKFIVYDHKEGRCFLVGRNLGDDAQELTVLLSPPKADEGKGTSGDILRHAPALRKRHRLKGNFTKKGYLEAIRQAKEYIARGDVYQVNLSQRFQTELDGAPHELYLRLRDINPAPFSAYLQFEDNAIISSSPERFLRVQSGRVQTCPIKGTRPRGTDPAADQRLMVELLHSPKDNAELAMIVDLERNDLGKVCNYGSVGVLEKRRLEAHPTVFHLVATVEGDLYPQYDLIDLLKATFPGGSVTGAPKIRAMEIIDELEPTARGVYTGAIGYIGLDGSMDLSIAIRTFLIKGLPAQAPGWQSAPSLHSRAGSGGPRRSGAVAFFQAGGGIVADSRPEEEYNETLFKSRALIESLCGY